MLFREHVGFVRAFLLRRGVPDLVVDDAVQEVFIVAYKLGGYHKGNASPRTWLGEIVLRVASNTRRKVKRNSTHHPHLDKLPATCMAPDVLFTQRRTNAIVEAAINTLTQAHKEVFLRFYLEGVSCQEIATELGIPIGTVYSRLHSARAKFTEAWTGNG